MTNFLENYPYYEIINPGVTLIKTRQTGVQTDRGFDLSIHLSQQSCWNEKIGSQAVL